MMFGSAKKSATFAADVKTGESEPLLKDGLGRRSLFQQQAGSSQTQSFRRKRRSSIKTGQLIPPSAALVSLITGRSLPPGAMPVKDPHPSPRIKSLPAIAPYTRKARHRSFYLRWLK